MNFVEAKKLLQQNFEKLTQGVNHLFEVQVDKEEMWELYLDSYPQGTNEIYRERREHDCSACRQFIKNIGNAVAIKDNKIVTIWDFETGDTTFQPVFNALDNYIKSKAITDVYINKERAVGQNKNHEQLESGEVITWEHFYVKLTENLVYKGVKSIGDMKGSYRDVRNVFKRSLDELTEESVLTVLELIAQKSLYKGEEWESVLKTFLTYKKEYSQLSEELRENYTWITSLSAGVAVTKIRNHSIGTLLVNISEGMDLDTAVKKYEVIVAPSNYKRPKAIFTKKMLEEAKKTVQDLGYENSLPRRYATLDDITVNNILFCNKDSAERIGAMDIFEEMSTDISIDPKRFSRAEEISIDDFVNNVLPIAKELEVFLENRHLDNMVSLIAPQDMESPSMFKWSNPFSWAYTGNITDSSMKENVKSAGGKVDGDLRFSIQWNDINRDTNDLDAHCIEPNGNVIMYNNKSSYLTKGRLDVDIIDPKNGIPAVENITWANRNTMTDGTYKFLVHNFSGGNKNGFRAEIEFDGNIYAFDHNQTTRSGQKTVVAEVTLKNGKFTIKEMLPSSLSSREVWGLKTNQFVPVSVTMFSPNYWDEQDGIGHRHYFFMLKDCVNSESPNGFYNEFLKQDLVQHKRVFEALGGKMAVQNVEDQLSGVGFSATKRNSVLVKVKGQSERVLKVKF